MIKVDKVLVEKPGSKAFTETIRGDLVIGVREWHKSVKDMSVVGEDTEMALVTMLNPLNNDKMYVRIAESADSFSQRLSYEQRNAKRSTPK